MKISKNKTIIILIAILLVFSIGYFIIVNKISYAFSDNYDLNNLYENTIETIKKCATVYGENNLYLFEDEKIIYIKVQDLIDNNLLATNEDGVVTNPLNENTSLNSNVIKIKYEDKKISVEIDS
ncbi:MAG: hypothetical protein E7161_04175 [Firmicutes bacterium]|nr:hypothetical protein [Bacillota bacterium]